MKHDEEPRKALGKRLAEARANAGMTLQHVGKMLGYKAAKQTVGHWETGHSVPDALTLAALCRLYKVEASAMLGLSPSPELGAWRELAHGMASNHPNVDRRDTLTEFCDFVDAEMKRIKKSTEFVKAPHPLKAEGKTL